ncbi:MAG TPA: signal peptidase I [Verrucomicrobiae bacterium]|nr:signal peptidase I [Verrucomicrobiae bacterium]
MIRWLFSKQIREVCALRKHVRRLLNAQRDILPPQAIGAVQLKMDELNAALAGGNKGEIHIKAEELEFTANKWIKSYPNPVWRENVEVLLVALAVAMGVRTFFLQPFKIPTGSMQPTLYGVTSRNLINDPNFKIPTGWERVKQWFEGISYIHVVAPADGTIDAISPMRKFAIFNIKQSISVGGVTQTIWFPPDLGETINDQYGQPVDPLVYRAGLQAGHFYHKGDDVIKLEVHAGDHLFVDRLTYNFRKPERGEIVVFETKGIPETARTLYRIPPDEFYIKRLCGLGGETISLKQDYEVADVPTQPENPVPIGNLVVNGEGITADTPHFANLYGFTKAPNGTTVIKYAPDQFYGNAMIENLAPGKEVQIPQDNSFVMGDNTMNSLDSRYWGTFPSQYIIGKAFFVYWPLTRRFGLSNE